MHRSSRLQMFFRIGVLKNFGNFTGKHLCRSPLFNKVAGLKVSNSKRLQHMCFPVKFANACFIIISVINIKCISSECIKVNVAFIQSQCQNLSVNGSSENMLAHALFLFLFFNYGLIEICFCFCFMNNKYYLMLLNLRSIFFSVKAIFLLMRNIRSEI